MTQTERDAIIIKLRAKIGAKVEKFEDNVATIWPTMSLEEREQAKWIAQACVDLDPWFLK
ncbi:hypothetical protein [Novosphingobium sp. 9U]|uniref:hypothetical protein n=1 Tax=Novosphingobium sp. 9U TaxID=2653158 RepID=UPI0012F04E22|nr:hypothetical protein [Novosphingobium sp. 9U]VWX50533.1 hypothetical protein NOVOSPHI9U_290052 [Novosphingobium sp. 9U]